MRIGFSISAVAAGMAFIAATLPAAAQSAGSPRQGLQPPAPGWTLAGTVLLSRHGMRGPTIAVTCNREDEAGKGCLDAVGENPWPTLDVAAGHLTTGGFSRVRTIGRFYRERYAAAGLLPAAGCPSASAVSFASDDVERTVMTAGAVMDGMFPGCFLDNLAISPTIYRGPTCGYDAAAAKAASQAIVGGSWAAVTSDTLAGPLKAMDGVVGPLKPEVCTSKGLPTPCSVMSIKATAEDPGPITFVSQPAEQFIMQYGSGLSVADTGWGRIEAATGKAIAEGIAYLNAIHALGDWAGGFPAYQAKKRGSQVLSVVARNLGAVAAGQGATFRFLSSHDNYILNVGGLLGLSWQLEGYAPWQVPPGGAIAFELWRDAAGALAVRLVYFAQTIAQLHADAPLTMPAPPAAEVLPVAGCAATAGEACPWTEFQRIAATAIDPACTNPAGTP